MPEVPTEVATATVADLFVWVLFIMFLAGIVTFLRKKIKPVTDALHRFLEDWSGEPERPGVPARLGVMQRLSAIEHELKPNSGSSFYDKLLHRDKANEARVGELQETVEALVTAVETLSKEVKNIKENCMEGC